MKNTLLIYIENQPCLMDMDNFRYFIEGQVKCGKHPEERYGQALFNYIFDLCHEAADEFRGSAIDPFYKDENADEFLKAVFTYCAERFPKLDTHNAIEFIRKNHN